MEVRNIQIAAGSQLNKPLVSLITPAFNEEALLQNNLKQLCDYMKSLEKDYDWELIIVNDGSTDNTGFLANKFAKDFENVYVVHHPYNRNLGCALQTGFQKTKGDIVIVMDIDLSYAPDHIERLLQTMKSSPAHVVVASPYMKGGKNTQVPFLRLLLSRIVNFLMRIVAQKDIHTFTGMVRAYQGEYIRSLNLKSSTYAINPEILYKSFILRKTVLEIPAHLDWTAQQQLGQTRTSSIRIVKGILSGLITGFIFRPYALFFGIGLFLMMIAMWIIIWIFIHVYDVYPGIEVVSGMANDQFSEAVRVVFLARPHAFFLGGIAMILSVLFLGISFLSFQSKRYFDELFHLESSLLKQLKQNNQTPE